MYIYICWNKIYFEKCRKTNSKIWGTIYYYIYRNNILQINISIYVVNSILHSILHIENVYRLVNDDIFFLSWTVPLTFNLTVKSYWKKSHDSDIFIQIFVLCNRNRSRHIWTQYTFSPIYSVFVFLHPNTASDFLCFSLLKPPPPHSCPTIITLQIYG